MKTYFFWIDGAVCTSGQTTGKLPTADRYDTASGNSN